MMLHTRGASAWSPFTFFHTCCLMAIMSFITRKVDMYIDIFSKITHIICFGLLYLNIHHAILNASTTTTPPTADQSIVYNYQLEVVLEKAICSYLSVNGISQNTIADRDIAEFFNRSARITTTLQNRMHNEQRTYVHTFEIEKIIHDELDVFIKRIKKTHPKAQEQTKPNGILNWVSSLFNNPKPIQPSAIELPTDQQIPDYELERQVHNTAYKVLRSYKLDPDKIPAHAISDYSDKIQSILRSAKNIMITNRRNFIWRDELEQIVLKELQPVIDKINFKGESCVICLDSYRKGQRVGITSCGHHYHKNCIYQWFEKQKSCPLCRAQNIIVEKIETIP